jgi:hypothetical protein
MKRLFRKTALIITAVFFLAAGVSGATNIIDPWYPTTSNKSEKNLYEIYNTICAFQTNYSASNQLPQLSDDDDNYWQITSDVGRILVNIQYAGYEQELGIIDRYDAAKYFTIVPTSSFNNGTYDTKTYFINYSDEFAFVEKLHGSGAGVGPWYSDDRNSPTVDHFVAFDVTQYFPGSANRAWIIAWEDLRDGGDRDYNDLVALVVDVKPTFAEEVIIDAAAEAGRVVVSWAAISETNVLGYNIYRAKGFAGAFQKLNDDLIMGKGSIETTVEYDFIDDTVDNGILYQYKIEEVGTDGLSLFHEPVKAIPRFIYNFFK